MIQFGTGGWRAIIGDGFTKANVRLLIQGLCDRMAAEGVTERGVVVGFDRRFLSLEAAQWACEVFAGNGVPVTFIGRPAPTPMFMWTVRNKNTPYGIAVTASHNPAVYNGIKVFTEGGRDAEAEVTNELMAHTGTSTSCSTRCSASPRPACRRSCTPPAARSTSSTTAKMAETDAVIGGESSGGLTVRGHIAGKDGIYAGSLLVEMVAASGKKLSELWADIESRYGKLEMVKKAYSFTPERRAELQDRVFVHQDLPDFAEVHGSWAVDRVTWDDGAKIYFTNGGWATIRFSGTEPVLRVFAEMEHLEDAEAVAATIADHLGLEG